MLKNKAQRTKACLLVLTMVLVTTCEARRRVHKRFIIHVPFKVKTHHHTHTVYSQIHSGGTKQTMYKILGYSMHGHGAAGHGHSGSGHGHGHMEHGGHGGGYGKGGYAHHYESEKAAHGELSYDGCDGHNHGDMIFNHFSRNDEEYPVELEEEFIDEEQGDDEWE